MGESLRGILELNALFLLAGLGLLWGVRGWSSLLDLLESLGLALMLGLSAVTMLATLILVAGGGLSALTVAVVCVALFAAGGALALAARRPLPSVFGRLPGRSAAAIAAAAAAIATVAVLVALFQLARIQPLGGGDSWEFWVPKAKVIYFDRGIDNPLFTRFAGPRYPLLVPALQAMDFRFMRSAFAPELAVQYWLLFVGFVFSAAALLRRLVPAWIAWLFVALTAVIPQLDYRLLNAQADWTLDLLYSLAALLAVCWLHRRERWLLVAAGIVLSAVIATKQEGLLLVGCLGAGIAAATLRSWRSTWPQLGAVGALAYTLNLPWRFWWASRHLVVAVPTSGVGSLLRDRSRIWPSLELVLRLLFSTSDWLVLVPLALTAAAACLTIGGSARETAVLYLVTCAAAVCGFTWILWTEASLPLNDQQSSTPIPRVVGSIVLLSAVLAPLLIQPLLERAQPRRQPPEARDVPDPDPDRRAAEA